MKKLLDWLKSPKSDFVLFIFLIILLNIASFRAYYRFDITAPKSYTLSKESKQLVKNLEEPLSIRVFFDSNLPNQYNQIYQYIKDILVEYKGAANKKFSVSFMDMTKQENIELAQNLGLEQVQIQEVKTTEVGFKQGFMGIVISYGDTIEVLNPISTTDGFEYKLTSTLSKMISMADTLNGIKADEKITLTLYLSDVLKSLGINGANEAPQIVQGAFESANKKNMGRLEYRFYAPDSSEVRMLAEKYGIQAISYDNHGEQSLAAVGLVLEYGDKFYALPLGIERSLFGYTLAGLVDVETSINNGLKSLLSNVKSIGYITGHQELDHVSEENAGNLEKLITGMYELVDLDLSKDEIPAGMNSIIINGPKYDFTEEELYKVDQFVMRGGNVLFFIDGVLDDGAGRQYGSANYAPFNINLDRLLNTYGVERGKNMVMDTSCYETIDRQIGKVKLYWAPVIKKNQLPKKNTITNNLNFIIMLQNGSLDVSKAQEDNNIKTTVLAKSSEEAWAMNSRIMLNPMFLDPPQNKEELKQFNLAVLLEGKFNSAFDKAPEKENSDSADNSDNQFSATNHISSSVMPGKVFVMGSSTVTTYQVIDAEGTSPVSKFIMNVIDYMNGHEDLCVMRSKVLTENNLTIKTPKSAYFWRFFEQIGIPLFVVIAGFIVYWLRSKRRRAINKKYNPNDTRTIE